MDFHALSQKKCKPCEGGMPPLGLPEAEELLRGLGLDWQLSKDGTSIVKQFRFKDDKEAVAFINAVAEIAIAQDHHPNLTWVYNRVTLEHSTHAIGGLSENDFILAAKIEDVLSRGRKTPTQ